eukprot:524909-Prorocentrum_minimum.AAC.1
MPEASSRCVVQYMRGQEGKYRSSVDAHEPQNPSKSEEYQGPRGVRRGSKGRQEGLVWKRSEEGPLDLDLDLDWTGPGPELDWTAAYLGRGGEGQPLDGLPVALQPVGSAGHLVQPAGAERVPVREDGLVVDEPQDGVQARAVVVVRHAAAVVALAGG